jgi:hypothetical protein
MADATAADHHMAIPRGAACSARGEPADISGHSLNFSAGCGVQSRGEKHITMTRDGLFPPAIAVRWKGFPHVAKLKYQSTISIATARFQNSRAPSCDYKEEAADSVLPSRFRDDGTYETACMLAGVPTSN